MTGDATACPRCGKALEGAVACLCRPPVSEEHRTRARAALAAYLAKRRQQWTVAASLPPTVPPPDEDAEREAIRES